MRNVVALKTYHYNQVVPSDNPIYLDSATHCWIM